MAVLLSLLWRSWSESYMTPDSLSNVSLWVHVAIKFSLAILTDSDRRKIILLLKTSPESH